MGAGGNESARLGSRDQGDWLSGKVQEGFLEEEVLNAQHKQDAEGERMLVLAEGAAEKRCEVRRFRWIRTGASKPTSGRVSQKGRTGATGGPGPQKAGSQPYVATCQLTANQR